MRYLVTGNGIEPFFTDWFDIENMYDISSRMVVFDLAKREYYDGNPAKVWFMIKDDHL